MSNTFYINFDKDIFIHGSSQFDTKNKEFPGDHGFNFEPHILKKIQRIEQLPCYRVAWQTYFDLWEETLFDAVIFRTSIWESLKNVTIIHHDYSRYWDTDAVGFDKARTMLEKSLSGVFESFPYLPRSGLSMFSSPLRHPMPPMSLELHFKWKCVEGSDYKTIACANRPERHIQRIQLSEQLSRLPIEIPLPPYFHAHGLQTERLWQSWQIGTNLAAVEVWLLWNQEAYYCYGKSNANLFERSHNGADSGAKLSVDRVLYIFFIAELEIVTCFLAEWILGTWPIA